MKRTALASVAVFVVLAAAVPAVADVAPASIFGDGMVLQRGQPVPIWGTADPRERITVRFADQERTVVASPRGTWVVRLDALAPGPPRTLTIAGRNEVTLGDVLVGDVWICSGQSNMEWPVSKSNAAEHEIASGRFPDIRLFTVARATAPEPRDACTGAWTPCSPDTVAAFSAVGYFFGRELHTRLDVPIGLINTTWGGTPAEAWTSRAAIEAGAFARILEAPAHQREQRRPAHLYNAMVHPLIPFAIRGAIWYQGEANAGRAHEYRRLLPAMIRDWRHRWGQGAFPFHVVQLAAFKKRSDDPGPSAWAELRDAQLETSRTEPAVGLAVTIDIGAADDIHPRNKQDVGRRLARIALANDYGHPLVPTGPVYRAHRVDGATVVLEFDHVASGLVASDDAPLAGFTIAGSDRTFHPADARIEGDRVVVSSTRVRAPVAVRYAWADNPRANLANRLPEATMLPATPFRTDRWPGTTERRPLSRWIFRAPLGNRDSTVVAALHDELWLAYDIGAGGLYLAWQGGLRTSAADQPAGITSPAYHKQNADRVWTLTRDGAPIATTVKYLNYVMRHERVTFRYELRSPDAPDLVVLVEESPEHDSTVAGDVSLVRHLNVPSLADGIGARLSLSGESRGERWSAEGAGRVAFEPRDDRTTPGAVLAIDAPGETTLTVTWTRPAPTVPTGVTPPNTLTEADRRAGWRLLFDGVTTAGWRGFGRADMPPSWAVENGALTRVAGGGDILTVEQFDDFELELEWRVAEGGNSGIFYRQQDGARMTGPEMQVLDNATHRDGGNPLHTAGACYDMYAPATDATRPVGAWNHVRIVARGNRIEHWLNRTLVVAYEVESPDWRVRHQRSKYRNAATYGRLPRGHILLQDHGDWVAYRSIRLRPLGDEGAAAPPRRP